MVLRNWVIMSDGTNVTQETRCPDRDQIPRAESMTGRLALFALSRLLLGLGAVLLPAVSIKPNNVY